MFRSVQTKDDQDGIYLVSGKIKEKKKRNTKAAIFTKKCVLKGMSILENTRQNVTHSSKTP